MAMKLTAAQQKEQAAHVASLVLAAGLLSTAVEAHTETLEASNEALREAVDAYNENLEGVRDWVADIASARRDEIDGRSETWRITKGAAAETWVAAFEGCELLDVDLEYPEPVELDLDHQTALEELPTEPD